MLLILKKKQQGPVIYFWLPQKVKNSCRDISAENLNWEVDLLGKK